MHGLGNDFVLLDIDQPQIELTAAAVQQLADRRTGIGFDQLLRLSPAAGGDLQVDIVNADGSHAEQCGNGMRAIAYLLHRQQRLDHPCVVHAAGGAVGLGSVAGENKYFADLPVPKLLKPIELITTATDNQLHDVYRVSVGNPHLVVLCENPKHLHQLDGRELAELQSNGTRQYRTGAFAKGCNAGFARRTGQNIELYVWERGAGPTKACGSGACAVAWVVMQQQGLKCVTVDQPGGQLMLEWLTDTTLRMTGAASYVYHGSIDWPEHALENSV